MRNLDAANLLRLMVDDLATGGSGTKLATGRAHEQVVTIAQMMHACELAITALLHQPNPITATDQPPLHLDGKTAYGTLLR